MSDPFVQRSDPEAAFAALSNDTRIAILRALQAADDHEATFSDLREAVGMRDPGQFNYHLDTLTGQFVAKTDAGYRLTQAGAQITGAMASGAYTVEGTIDPIALDDPCRVCESAQTFHYEDETVRVECESCETVSTFVVPPAVFAGHDREAFPRVASRYLRSTIQLQYNGFCWYCNGHMERTVGPLSSLDSESAVPEERRDASDDSAAAVPWAQFDCQRCGATATVDLGTVLLVHPAVAGFYHDHGIDVRERLVWAFPPMDAVDVSVRERAPLRAAVSYAVETAERTVIVDEDLDVVDVES